MKFKSRRRSYRKPRRPVPLPIILMAIPLILISLELLARIFVGFTGKSAELAAYEGQPALATAYHLKFLGQSQQPYDGIFDRGRLAAQRQFGIGYSLVGKQKSQYWGINEQGFRDNDPLPIAKPKNEIRIFLLGGSTAFGQWSASNQATLASKLETRLNERIAQQKRTPEKYRPTVLPYFKSELDKVIKLPLRLRDGQYRVINAAVPGYTSGNELAQLALQILPYSPDAIVVLDGYGDLMLPSNQAAKDIPHTEAFLNNASGHYWTTITHQLKDTITGTYFVKALQYWLLRPEPNVAQTSLVATENAAPLEQHLAVNPGELDSRVARHHTHQAQMVRLATGAGIPILLALQPEITGRGSSRLSPKEQAILKELKPSYTQQVQTGYAELAQANEQLQKAFPKNVKTLNFYKFYENFSKPAFYDTVHLTEEGNTALAEQFYRVITSLPKLQVAPPKPPT